MKRFIRDESGAVTADWAVLAAATVGLGLAVAATMSGGLALQGMTVEGTLRGAARVQTAFGAAATTVLRMTSAFVEDARIAPGGGTGALDGVTAFSFAMEATLAADESGILFAAGGRRRGVILYQHEGRLYLQAGDGRGYGPAATRGEAVWEVRDGVRTIEGSLDASHGLALYVDGTLVARDGFVGDRLAVGGGASAEGGSLVATNRGGFIGSDAPHAGAGELVLFLDETTGDERGG